MTVIIVLLLMLYCLAVLQQPCSHSHVVLFFLKDLENALNCLQREDPSLKVRVDPDSGQVIPSLD